MAPLKRETVAHPIVPYYEKNNPRGGEKRPNFIITKKRYFMLLLTATEQVILYHMRIRKIFIYVYIGNKLGDKRRRGIIIVIVFTKNKDAYYSDNKRVWYWYIISSK